MIEYIIIGLIAWNIIVSLKVYSLSKTSKTISTVVLAMDDGCKKMFTKIVDAVNVHSKILNALIGTEDDVPTKRIQ